MRVAKGYLTSVLTRVYYWTGIKLSLSPESIAAQAAYTEFLPRYTKLV
jgi:hypothetical protein